MAQMQAPQSKFTELFRKSAPQQFDPKSLSEDVNNISRRLRTLEEGFTNLRRTLQVTEHNVLEKNKLFSTDIRALTSDINDIRKDIDEIKEKIIDMVAELELAAKREEVKVLEKYINFWNPVKFVTQNEVEAIVREILKQEKDKAGKEK